MAAARSRAQRHGTSIGQALSELALMGYESETASITETAGFPVLPPVGGHVITVDMVEDALDDE